jgi:hypothetical protein
MFTEGARKTGRMEPSRDSSLVANGPPAPGRLHFRRALPPSPCARFPDVKQPSRRSRTAAAFCATLTMLLLAAPAALAENGEGLAGRVTDKTVTFFCFGVIAFFAILVIVLSLIQGRLEKRKEMRKATISRLG